MPSFGDQPRLHQPACEASEDSLPPPLPETGLTVALAGCQTWPMTSPLPSDTTRQVVQAVPKATDLELHISALETPFGKYAEIREYVPSQKIYGRGVLIPEGGVLDDVLNALEVVFDAPLDVEVGDEPSI